MNFLLDTRMCCLCLTLSRANLALAAPSSGYFVADRPKPWIPTLFPGSLIESFPYRWRWQT